MSSDRSNVPPCPSCGEEMVRATNETGIPFLECPHCGDAIGAYTTEPASSRKGLSS